MHSLPGPVAQAYQHCLGIARRHRENFPTASRLIAPHLRPAVAAVYAFARTADDIADEGEAPAEVRRKQLDAWETLLARTEAGRVPDHPVFVALDHAFRNLGLPPEPLHELLVAFRMDLEVHAYASEEELRFYCRHSANPIGRILLALHGVNDPEAVAASDALCTALQWINFWQDLGPDLARGRCYLPAEWLEPHGLKPDALIALQEIAPAKQRAIVADACNRTRPLLAAAADLPSLLPLRLRLQAGLTLRAAYRLLARIEKSPEPLAKRPSLTAWDWTWLSLTMPACLRSRRGAVEARA